MALSNLGSFTIGPVENEGISSVTLANSVMLGTRLIYNGEEYVYCYNTGGASITAGYAAINSLCSGFSVTVSSTAETDVPYVFCKHATAVTASYFWGLTRGVVQANFTSTMATGTPIQLGTAGQVMTYTTAAQSFPGEMIGRTLSSATATSFGLCWVRCYG